MTNIFKQSTKTLLTLSVVVVLISIFASLAYADDQENGLAKQDNVNYYVGYHDNNDLSSQKTLELGATNDLNDQQMFLLTFNQYMEAADVENFAQQNSLQVNEIFISQPNVTGRGIIANTQENGLANTIAAELQDIYNNSSSELVKNDIGNLMNNYKIFAITFTASREDILLLSNSIDGLGYLDQFFNENAELQAKNSNVKVNYIALPNKPDGTY